MNAMLPLRFQIFESSVMIGRVKSAKHMGFSGTPKDMGPPYGKRDPNPTPMFESLKIWE